MGATTDYRILDGNLEGDSLRKAWSEAVDEALYEEGNGGYTGTIAEAEGERLVIRDLFFYSVDAAVTWIEENAEKWNPSVALKAVGQDGNHVWVVGGCYPC